MWPEDCARRLLPSPLTQTWPTCFSSNARIRDVSSDTDKTLRSSAAGNNSPKFHWDLEGLLTELTWVAFLRKENRRREGGFERHLHRFAVQSDRPGQP